MPRTTLEQPPNNAMALTRRVGVPLTEFTLFRRLPKHLRVKVWKLAIEDISPRIVILESKLTARVSRRGTVHLCGALLVADSDAEVPALLRANPEARELALEVYKPILEPINKLRVLYFRYDKDILHAKGWSVLAGILSADKIMKTRPFWRQDDRVKEFPSVTQATQQSVREFRENLTHLIVSTPTQLKNDAAPHFLLTPEFPGLQRLTLEVPTKWTVCEVAFLSTSKHLVDFMEVHWNRAHMDKKLKPKFPLVTWMYPHEIAYMDDPETPSGCRSEHMTYRAADVYDFFWKSPVKPKVSRGSLLKTELQPEVEIVDPPSPRRKVARSPLLVDTLRAKYQAARRVSQ